MVEPDSTRQVTWPGGARLAVSVVINFEEGAELTRSEDGRAEARSELTPPSHINGRDLASESFYEYGIRAGAPRLASILAQWEVPATIFACGRAVEKHPEIARRLSDEGHEIAGHGYQWIWPAELTEAQEAGDINATIEAIVAATDRRPTGWYSRYGPSVNTRRLLREIGGFTYDSDSYADDVPYWDVTDGDPFLVVPYTLDVNDIKFWVPPGYGGPDDFEACMKRTFNRLLDETADGSVRMMSVGLHLRIAGRPGRADAVADFLRHASSHDDVWFATREDIADWWRRHYPPPVGDAPATTEMTVST